MSEIVETKRDYKENVEKEYERIADLYKNGKRHDEEIAVELLNILKTYFDHMQEIDSKEPWFDVGLVIEIVSGQKGFKTHQKDYYIGCFICALSLLGSTDNQAYMAVGKWLGLKGISTTRRAYELFKKKGNYEEDMDVERFVYLNVYFLKKVLDMTESDFPSHSRVVKAKQAYDRLESLIENNLNCETDQSVSYILK